jgi:hypothetical protein
MAIENSLGSKVQETCNAIKDKTFEIVAGNTLQIH